MSGSLEEAYVAVERAYGQGDFASALQLAQALRPQVQTGRPDLMDQRLQLLHDVHDFGRGDDPLLHQINDEQAHGAPLVVRLVDLAKPCVVLLCVRVLNGVEQRHELLKTGFKDALEHCVVLVQQLAKQARVHRRKKVVGTGRVENGAPHRLQMARVGLVF